MAAERICFSIAPGARQSHRLVCQPAPAEEGGAEGHGRLSRLEWSAVVLDEKLIDLEVHVILQPQEEGAGQGLEWLQQKASGRTFQGAFVPGEHPRLKQVPAERIESVIFEFDNSYSWFTAKDVELVVLRTDEDDGRSRPPPRPRELRPGSPLPLRRPGASAVVAAADDRAWESARAAPRLLPDASHPRESGAAQAAALFAGLGAVLAAAEAMQPPASEPSVPELLKSCAALRAACAEGLQQALALRPP
mmetsp:Transcript_82315/g.209201  ORF Transcript_82315/g.209201 Transcript_82315/m.209201 type:complete len:249 (+) Transcript_82315:108-854(+)